MQLRSETRFVSKETQEEFYKLENGNAKDREIFKVINNVLDKLEENAFSGIQIPKKIIPQYYIQKYDIKNLWKYNMPKGWRLMYSLVNGEVLVITIILEWLNHTDYENRFKY